MDAGENFIISALSLNVDQQAAPEKDIPELFDPLPDYYVEFTQEDSRPVDNAPLIGSENLHGLQFLANVSLNTTYLLKSSPQNMMIKIYGSPSLPSLRFKEDGKAGEPVTGRIPLAIGESRAAKAFKGFQTASGFTKGAVWIQLHYEYYSLLFINLHLPVDPLKNKNNDYMGYQYRTASFKQILAELQDKIKTSTFTLFGGDLNFRINSQGVDQLEQLLKEREETNESIDLPIQEVPFPNTAKKTYTCKFKTEEDYRKKKMKTDDLVKCRLTSIGNKRNTSCQNEERIPSRCDRFLYNSLEPPRVLLQKTGVYIPNSDHNAVYLMISPRIRKLPIGGGKHKKTRKQKHKRRLEKTRKQK